MTAQPIRINNTVNPTVLYPGTTTPYYKYDTLNTGFYGTYPMYNRFQFKGQMYQKFDYVSIVSCRYNDIYQNSGVLFVDALEFQLPVAPMNVDQLVAMLNNNTFTDTTGTTVLNTLYTFAKTADSKGIANTCLQYTNADGQAHNIKAVGNIQNLMGIHTSYSTLANEVGKFSDDNSLRIEYIVLKSPDINGDMQLQRASGTGWFDRSTICVADFSNGFQYANKNLDVHMTIQRQTPCMFEIVDQTDRPVTITYCFLEMLMYPKDFFNKTKIERVLRNGLKHEKEQQHLYLTPTNKTFVFNSQFKEISISDIQGYVDVSPIYLYRRIFAIYCAEVGQYPIGIVIVTSDLVLQPQSRDIFMWDECQHKGVSTLHMTVMEYSKDLLSQSEVTDYPNMIIRLLIK